MLSYYPRGRVLWASDAGHSALPIGGEGMNADLAVVALYHDQGHIPVKLLGFEVRYPDPASEILDPSFAKYRRRAGAMERLRTGPRWSEGPVWVADQRCLVWSE